MSAPSQHSGQRVGATFPQFVRHCARTYGDDVAVELVGEGIAAERLTFLELEARSADLAKGLLARGVGKGTRIGFIFGNGPNFVVTLAAITRIGAVAIAISTLTRSEELVRVLRRSDVAGLIVQRRLLGHDLAARLCEALPELGSAGHPELRLARVPYLRWIVSSGEDLRSSFRATDFFAEAAESVDDEVLKAVESEVHPTDQMIEIYTSGSMAEPKGVRHNHGPVMARVHYLAEMMQRPRGTSVTIPLPMFWVGGLGQMLLVNLASGVVSRCTEGTSTNSGAARGSVFSEAELKARGASEPYWSLGMTETFGPYSYGDEIRAPGQPLAPPIDHVAPGFEIRVIDANVEVGDGEVGEIEVRGYAVTPGLHKIERSEHFTSDGFYRTGDLGLVEGKRIHFQGRDGDMIKTAKANVSPAEVEMELQQVDGVQTAFVVGLPDAERGQIVVAAVVPNPGAELDFDSIEASLKARMSGYKVPRAFALLDSGEVPMLPSNKVARRELGAMLAEKLGRAPATLTRTGAG